MTARIGGPEPRPDWSNTPPNERRDPPKYEYQHHAGEKRARGPLALAFLVLSSLLALVGLSQK